MNVGATQTSDVNENYTRLVFVGCPNAFQILYFEA